MLGFLLAGLVVIASPHIAEARLTDPQPTNADIWCVGTTADSSKPNSEICIDNSGDIIPLGSNLHDIGTSSLQFATGYFNSVVVASSMTLPTGTISPDHIQAGGSIVRISTTDAPGTQQTVTSTDYIAVAQSTVTITTIGSSNAVKLQYSCPVGGSAGIGTRRQIYVQAVRGDTVVGTIVYARVDNEAVERYMISGTLIDPALSAGTYTYSLMTKVDASGAYLKIGNEATCTFTAQEVSLP